MNDRAITAEPMTGENHARSGIDRRCPECGTPVERREPFDRFQNTRLQPCDHIVAAGDCEAEWSA